MKHGHTRNECVLMPYPEWQPSHGRDREGMPFRYGFSAPRRDPGEISYQRAV
jgi:hypothetical protein